jgi:glycosyltransferase involved in cell wall biosynthesis
VNGSGPIRVLLANHHVWEPGGAENFAVYLAAGLDRLGYRVVLTWNRERPLPAWPDGEVPRTVEVIRHGYSGVRDIRARLPMSLWDPRIRGDMRRLCGQIAPDVIHVNQIYEGDGIDLVRGALEHGKCRVFGTIHLRVDPPEANRLLGAGKRFLLRSFFRRHRYIKICPSASQRAGFARVYGDDGLLRVVPNGIPLPPVLNDRGIREAKLVLGAEGKTVLAYAGRICREKGMDTLVAAFLDARKRRGDLFLLVIGDGPMRAEMERALGGEVSAGRALFTGWVPDAVRHLAAADLFVLPTRFEAMPLSVIEAQSMGIPCLCTPYEGIEDLLSLGAIPEVADGMGAKEFSAGLARVLAALPTCRERALNGMPKVREVFSHLRMAEETARLYDE